MVQRLKDEHYLQERVEASQNEHEGKTVVETAAERTSREQREAREKRQAIFENSSSTERILIFEHTMRAFERSGNIQDDQIQLVVSYVDTNPEVLQVADRMHGNTLLHICVQRNLADAARSLVMAGANVKAPNGNAQTPVSLATSNTMRGVLDTYVASANAQSSA